MDSLISQIITLAEPARPEAYRRHLSRMTQRELQEKLAVMEADANKKHAPNWQGRSPSHRQEIKIS